jgi:hypothetical protein
MRRRTGKGKEKYTGRVCVCSALSNANGALHCLRYTTISILRPIPDSSRFSPPFKWLHLIRTAIYSRIPGLFENLTETGPVINTLFLFGNGAFPIHPLDMNFMLEESTLCWRSAYYPYRTSSDDPWLHWSQFQPIPTGAAPDYDMIL